MPFGWSLNPYTGCVHRCTFCYVRAFELRADRPADDRYGRSIRVKVNVAEVLGRELARPSWSGESIAIGAATDPYQPAEGRYRLTRACIEVLGRARDAFLDHHARAADRPRRRCAGGRGQTNQGLGDVFGAHSRPRGLAHDRAGRRRLRASGCGLYPSSSPPGSMLGSAWRRSSRASPTVRSSSPKSSKPYGRQGLQASGQTCSTCARGRRSTSSKHSPRTGPRSSRGRAALCAGRLSPHSEAEPVRSRVPRSRPGARCARPPHDEARAAAGARSALAARLRADIRHTLPANARRDHVPDRR